MSIGSRKFNDPIPAEIRKRVLDMAAQRIELEKVLLQHIVIVDSLREQIRELNNGNIAKTLKISHSSVSHILSGRRG